MRRSTEFELKTEDGDIQVVIKEIRPRDIINDIKGLKQGATITEFDELLSKCTNLTSEQLMNLYPSELEIVIGKLKEVNKSFLSPWSLVKKIIDRVGLIEWLGEIVEEIGLKDDLKKAILTDLKSNAADSLKEDM